MSIIDIVSVLIFIFAVIVFLMIRYEDKYVEENLNLIHGHIDYIYSRLDKIEKLQLEAKE